MNFHYQADVPNLDESYQLFEYDIDLKTIHAHDHKM